MKKQLSPCLSCTRVPNPENCENKNCAPWRKWFLKNWDNIHNYPKLVMEQTKLIPMGVPIGGKYYAHPHRVREYRSKHPCSECYAQALCKGPCKILISWQQEGGNYELEK